MNTVTDRVELQSLLPRSAGLQDVARDQLLVLLLESRRFIDPRGHGDVTLLDFAALDTVRFDAHCVVGRGRVVGSDPIP